MSPEPSPLAARFAQLARSHANQPALTVRGTDGVAHASSVITYHDFWQRVQLVTAHLQDLGLRRTERVAWLGLNHDLQLVTLVACARLGAIFMPLNFRLAVAELQQVLHQAQPRVLVHDTSFQANALAVAAPGLHRWHHDQLLGAANPKSQPLPPHPDPGTQVVLLSYTSGTSGQPKGAMHTQAGLLANAQASVWAHDLTANDTVLSVLPLFHVGGMCIQTLPALLSGAHVVMHARFDAQAWLNELSLSQPSLSLLVPTTLKAVLECAQWPQTSLACLRGLMTGSSTVPLAYFDALHARDVPMGQVYGCTETGPVSLVMPLTQARQRAGESGWPHPHCQVKLMNEHGQRVVPGQVGEVCLQANNLMCGYWQGAQDAGATQGVGLDDGWFHTGDLGLAATDGSIRIVGRAKDMIISGGENIYPAEIENLLLGFEGLGEVAVLGWPDAHWGEVPVLVLEQPSSQPLAPNLETAIQAHLQAHLARFKWPKRLLQVPAFPRSALGKIRKADLLADLLHADTTPTQETAHAPKSLTPTNRQ